MSPMLAAKALLGRLTKRVSQASVATTDASTPTASVIWSDAAVSQSWHDLAGLSSPLKEVESRDVPDSSQQEESPNLLELIQEFARAVVPLSAFIILYVGV